MFSKKGTKQHVQPQDWLHVFPICVRACVFTGRNNVYSFSMGQRNGVIGKPTPLPVVGLK